jgi:beta-porphyranase
LGYLNEKNQILSMVMLLNLTGIFAQPPAPTGYKWIKNNIFSDEFNGTSIDTAKWYARSPYWKNGRPPATLREENVSVKNGSLQIKDVVLSPPEGRDINWLDVIRFNKN